jgi:hypothetical protein
MENPPSPENEITCRPGQADGMQHRIRHRAVVERAHDPPLAVHLQVARRPGNRRADIARENGVFRGELTDDAGHGLRMNKACIVIQLGQGIELLA